MKFADDTQRQDFLATLRRLRGCASHWQLQDSYVGDLTIEELGERVAELRNVEQVLVSIYEEIHDRTVPPPFLAEPRPVPREKPRTRTSRNRDARHCRACGAMHARNRRGVS